MYMNVDNLPDAPPKIQRATTPKSSYRIIFPLADKDRLKVLHVLQSDEGEVMLASRYRFLDEGAAYNHMVKLAIKFNLSYDYKDREANFLD